MWWCLIPDGNWRSKDNSLLERNRGSWHHKTAKPPRQMHLPFPLHASQYIVSITPREVEQEVHNIICNLKGDSHWLMSQHK